jgi:hypothetical protein
LIPEFTAIVEHDCLGHQEDAAAVFAIDLLHVFDFQLSFLCLLTRR